MDRRTRTVAQILGIIFLTVLLSILAYFIGSMLAKPLVAAGTGISLTQWQDHYKKLIYALGFMTGALSLGWYLLARFGMRISDSYGVGKRGVWAVFGILTLVACIALPYIYSSMDAVLKISVSIPLVFVVLYAVIGYWGGSIATAPAAYKYTPLGADKIRAPKDRK